jgi:hypothetical protein
MNSKPEELKAAIEKHFAETPPEVVVQRAFELTPVGEPIGMTAGDFAGKEAPAPK